MINFKRYFQTASFLDPRKGFKPVEQIVEFRRDPLIHSRWCRINQERPRRTDQSATTGKNEKLEGLIQDSKQDCPFAKGRIETQTPKFPVNLVSKGRIVQGQSVVFPNLYPFDKHHAVCVISDKHSMTLSEITPELWKNAFQACIEYQKQVFETDPDARYPLINMNFNPPAGASIIHPHLQVLMSYSPTNLLRNEVAASEQYYERNSSCFWQDLIEKERELKARFIRAGEHFTWIASWAPIGDNEVLGIIDNPIACIFDIDERVLGSFCRDLSRVLTGLWEQRNVRSLNFTLYSGPAGKQANDYYRLHVRMISRPGMSTYYTSDCGFMELLHQEPIIKVLPETLAKTLRTRL